MKSEFIGNLPHGHGFEGLGTVFHEVILIADNHFGDAVDRGFPQFQTMNQRLAGINFGTQIGFVLGGKSRIFQHFLITAGNGEPSVRRINIDHDIGIAFGNDCNFRQNVRFVVMFQ